MGTARSAPLPTLPRPPKSLGCLHRCPGSACRAPPRKGLDCFLECLGGAERDLLARLDLDRLAGGRVAAHAGGALADLKDAEAADTDAVTFLEVLHHQADEVTEIGFGLLLCDFMGAGQGGGEMLEGNGCLCGWCLCHRKLLL